MCIEKFSRRKNQNNHLYFHLSFIIDFVKESICPIFEFDHKSLLGNIARWNWKNLWFRSFGIISLNSEHLLSKNFKHLVSHMLLSLWNKNTPSIYWSYSIQAWLGQFCIISFPLEVKYSALTYHQARRNLIVDRLIFSEKHFPRINYFNRRV